MDELPLGFGDFGSVPFSSAGASGRTNPMETRFQSSSVPPHFQLALEQGLAEGVFPVHRDALVGGGDRSIRRLSGIENITTRDNKRPKERSKDKEYRRLTLTGFNQPTSVPLPYLEQCRSFFGP